MGHPLWKERETMGPWGFIHSTYTYTYSDNNHASGIFLRVCEHVLQMYAHAQALICMQYVFI